jgi:hypothetical protein
MDTNCFDIDTRASTTLANKQNGRISDPTGDTAVFFALLTGRVMSPTSIADST